MGECSEFNCDIWQTNIDEGSYKVTAKVARIWSPAGCHSHVNDWWSWNLSVKPKEVATRPGEVERGSGEHLTTWCKFNVDIFPLPEEYCMESFLSLQQWVYPNGYTVRHIYNRAKPYYPQLWPTC